MQQLKHWTNAVKKQLSPALSGAKGTIKREVLTGVCKLWSFNDGELLAVTRLEGTEFVLVAVAGKSLRKYTPEIYSYAKQVGALTLRTHTQVPKVIGRALRDYPFKLIEVRKSLFQPPEFVYRMDLYDEQTK